MKVGDTVIRVKGSWGKSFPGHTGIVESVAGADLELVGDTNTYNARKFKVVSYARSSVEAAIDVINHFNISVTRNPSKTLYRTDDTNWLTLEDLLDHHLFITDQELAIRDAEREVKAALEHLNNLKAALP